MTKPNSGSDGKPSALMLGPESPYPLVGGGALRSAALMHYLAAHYELDLVVFREESAPQPAQSLPHGLVRRLQVIDLPVHSRSTVARATRNLRRLVRGVPPLNDRFAGFDKEISSFVKDRHYDLAVIEHFWCAGYHHILPAYCDRLVLDLHNVESVLHARCAGAESWPLSQVHRRFHSICRRLERAWLPKFALLLTVSQTDEAFVREIVPEARTGVYPNTIPAVAAPIRQEEDRIIFSAYLDYHPNVAAARYFGGEIWPLLRDRWPGLEWAVIGKNPQAVEKDLGEDPRIRLVGPVDNAVETLAKAKVAVAPLLAGSGTRIKILEAWAAGVPVVSTTIGAEGLPGRHGEHLLIADDPRAFADAVSWLLGSRELRERLGQAGRALYEHAFTWKAGWRKLEQLGI
jgi:glycosyltransferase involved in cell wall biosynthesis